MKININFDDMLEIFKNNNTESFSLNYKWDIDITLDNLFDELKNTNEMNIDNLYRIYKNLKRSLASSKNMLKRGKFLTLKNFSDNTNSILISNNYEYIVDIFRLTYSLADRSNYLFYNGITDINSFKELASKIKHEKLTIEFLNKFYKTSDNEIYNEDNKTESVFPSKLVNPLYDFIVMKEICYIDFSEKSIRDEFINKYRKPSVPIKLGNPSNSILWASDFRGFDIHYDSILKFKSRNLLRLLLEYVSGVKFVNDLEEDEEFRCINLDINKIFNNSTNIEYMEDFSNYLLDNYGYDEKIKAISDKIIEKVLNLKI